MCISIRPKEDAPRNKVMIKHDGWDVIVCERGEVSLARDEKGFVQEWHCEFTEPTGQQIDDKIWMIRVILERLLNGVGMTETRLEIAARLSRLAAEVREGSQVMGVER